MRAYAVIKQFDVIKDRGPRFLPCPEVIMERKLVLQISKEALGHGIVMAVANTAHADFHTVFLQ
jgi:hypothetical protein